MAKRSSVTQAEQVEQAAEATQPAKDWLPAGFGAEFRELARQRRFVRETHEPAPERTVEPRDVVVPPAPDRPAAAPPTAPPAVARSGARMAVGARTPRLSDDALASLGELARMSDRLVESREQLAVQRQRADRAEAELAAVNERLMAARVLVHDAQRATRETAERCAWLEGRAETLQEALDMAVHASLIARWRWRRRLARDGA